MSLRTRVFDTRKPEENISRAKILTFPIFVLIISNGEKIPTNINVVVWSQVEGATAHFRLLSASHFALCDPRLPISFESFQFYSGQKGG